ncbi:DeoR/GlpR family DNA-binding transcription regulator [Paludifilum halophilum]|uniref:Transcriptional regulator n=1 Tax=Paludifilum halophilum TaxID=1642702 RepID=A0A235B540_9BACL|nr:DeoR/GlpR family DNA-binding transcription regulator [Paludifilum halophilum]OYD07414.1 transcriptional regulator [Paludifilum halophilum]
MVKLFVSERRKEIMQILHRQHRITVKELSKKVGVSEATLRMDLNQMEKEGLLKRTHGGAILNDYIENETTFSVREKKNRAEKMKIAEKAEKLIESDQCLLLDGSSTALELARVLKNKKIRLTVVTNGIYTALELRENPDITCILIGGIVQKGSGSLEGTIGTDTLKNINVDIMFTSAYGFCFETGLTDFNVYEVELKKEMIKKANKVVALIDHTKINKSSISSFVSADHIDRLITDMKLPEDMLKRFRDCDIHVDDQ